jgi:hypothetical protein
MPYDQSTIDEKNNLVVVTLFESYLAKFVLENPKFYQTVYYKIFDAIENYLKEDLEKNRDLDLFLRNGPPNFSASRYIYSVFSRVNSLYPGQDSFETLKSNFHLLAADYFIKLISDELLNKIPYSPISFGKQTSESAPDSPGFFSSSIGKRSPFNPNRPAELFNEKDRGVFPIIREESEEFDEPEIRDLGIVSKEFTPPELTDYFEEPIFSARFYFQPNESSSVATWCRRRHLPVISGSSGSTEMLFSRIMNLLTLTHEETKLLVFSQACSMIANGHHSFFDAILVADHFGLKLEETDTLLEFYLQCVPDEIKAAPSFIEFLESASIQPLLQDIPLLNYIRRHSVST